MEQNKNSVSGTFGEGTVFGKSLQEKKDAANAGRAVTVRVEEVKQEPKVYKVVYVDHKEELHKPIASYRVADANAAEDDSADDSDITDELITAVKALSIEQKKYILAMVKQLEVLNGNT